MPLRRWTDFSFSDAVHVDYALYSYRDWSPNGIHTSVISADLNADDLTANHFVEELLTRA